MIAPISASVVAVVFRRLSVLAVLLVSVAHVEAERPISIGSVAFMGDRDAFAAPASSVFSLGFSTTGAGPMK